MVNNPKEREMERPRHYQWKLTRSITERFDYCSKDIRQISEQKDYVLQNWGACVDTIFWKKQVKMGKEKQPMKSRVQSAD
jgi:hypothetical protein